MAYFFDEQKLKAPLSAMTEDEREQYVIGIIDLTAMLYRRNRQRQHSWRSWREQHLKRIAKNYCLT